MAYKPSNLSVVAFANSFPLWHYVTDATKLDLASEDYFDRACDMVRAGDMLFVNFVNFGPAATIVTIKSNVDGRATIDNLIPLNSKE